MPSVCRLIVRAKFVKFTILIPGESCTNAKAKYSSSVVPPDPSVHFYHWVCVCACVISRRKGMTRRRHWRTKKPKKKPQKRFIFFILITAFVLLAHVSLFVTECFRQSPSPIIHNHTVAV